MNLDEINKKLDEILGMKQQEFARDEAIHLLKSCGILDENGNIHPVYQDVLQSPRPSKTMVDFATLSQHIMNAQRYLDATKTMLNAIAYDCIAGHESRDPDNGAIYTHDAAMTIVESFEHLLVKHNVYIPSPEDDERDPDDKVGLYGSVYSDLLDEIESLLCGIIHRAQDGAKIVEGAFSGTI